MAGKKKKNHRLKIFQQVLFLKASKEKYTHGTFNIHRKII